MSWLSNLTFDPLFTAWEFYWNILRVNRFILQNEKVSRVRTEWPILSDKSNLQMCFNKTKQKNLLLYGLFGNKEKKAVHFVYIKHLIRIANWTKKRSEDLGYS